MHCRRRGRVSRHRAEVDAVEELEDDRAVPSKLGVRHVTLYDVQLDLPVGARVVAVPAAEALQAPARFYAQLGFIDNHNRRQNHAMIMLMDESVGRIADALQQRGMWAETLLVWSSDNGGAVHLGGGANSFPLRGG